MMPFYLKKVISVMNNYYELRPCKPRISKLKKLLEENMFSGRECEEDEQHQGQKVRKVMWSSSLHVYLMFDYK